jgi:ubiquinone/menaquinone biosynthesis C-methylase UbiE
MNYFAPRNAAERYAQGRPDVHQLCIDEIGHFLQLEDKLDKALDIACGTGLSTKALLPIAHQVYGTDIAPEMLQYAPHKDIIHYALAPAEQQPFDDQSFDLITVSSGVHWFDIDRFLAEARRLLKRNGWLVLYENYFNAQIQDAEGFKIWHTGYLLKFPSPPRNNRYDWSNANLHPKGLHYVREFRSLYTQPLTKQQLILYLTTQSNVIARVENGDTSYEAVEAWLNDELSAFFPNTEPREVGYGNWIKFIQQHD